MPKPFEGRLEHLVNSHWRLGAVPAAFHANWKLDFMIICPYEMAFRNVFIE